MHKFLVPLKKSMTRKPKQIADWEIPECWKKTKSHLIVWFFFCFPAAWIALSNKLLQTTQSWHRQAGERLGQDKVCACMCALWLSIHLTGREALHHYCTGWKLKQLTVYAEQEKMFPTKEDRRPPLCITEHVAVLYIRTYCLYMYRYIYIYYIYTIYIKNPSLVLNIILH